MIKVKVTYRHHHVGAACGCRIVSEKFFEYYQRLVVAQTLSGESEIIHRFFLLCRGCIQIVQTSQLIYAAFEILVFKHENTSFEISGGILPINLRL